MKQKSLDIRTATEQDAQAILDIYAPYVKNTAVTFEYEVPDATEFTGRIRHILARYPYLVAEMDDKIVGYAYADRFHSRPAYDWCAETAIYVEQSHKKMGIGRRLYEALEKSLMAQNVLNLNACIAYLQTEDEYLTRSSVEFHRALGYRLVGEFYQCGYKFGRWYNMVWMEKHIGIHPREPLPVKRFFDVGML